MLNKAQKLFYAVVLTLTIVAGVVALGPRPAVAGVGGGGGTTGVLSYKTLK